MSRSSRLFELINILRSHRMPVTADDPARQLGISPRSVYRDIDTLRSLGAPVYGQAGVGFRLGGGFFLPEFVLLPEEIDALILGLGWVQQRADPALGPRYERAGCRMRPMADITLLACPDKALLTTYWTALTTEVDLGRQHDLARAYEAVTAHNEQRAAGPETSGPRVPSG